MTRLAILTSHPIQYYGPLFRELAKSIDLHVFFAHRATPEQQSKAGFGAAFDWDVDITSDYSHSFLQNVSRHPGTSHFFGCDTPDIADRLKSGNFDAVLTMGWHLKSLVQGIVAAKRHNIPVLVRGDSQLGAQKSRLKRVLKAMSYPLLLRVFDRVTYVGERSKEYYRAYGYPESRMFFSPHCIDTAFFSARATDEARANLRRELGVAEGAFLLLFAGKLVPFKRPLDLVEAAAICRRRGIPAEVVVAGSGELAEGLREAARTAATPLHMLGFRNQSQMPAAYAASDVLVLPSEGRETWGLVGNEALACGRPVVVSNACGCGPDLAADGHVGRVFQMGDVEAMADALASLYVARPTREAVEGKSVV